MLSNAPNRGDFMHRLDTGREAMSWHEPKFYQLPGDGIEGSLAEYWELLFDLDTGYWKEEIQDEYEASGCDLLINRQHFGPVCGLVACKPWPQFTPALARDWKALIESTRCGTR
jgi:hypothetical protein